MDTHENKKTGVRDLGAGVAPEGLFWEQAAERHRCRVPRTAGLNERVTKLALGSGGLARAGSLSTEGWACCRWGFALGEDGEGEMGAAAQQWRGVCPLRWSEV